MKKFLLFLTTMVALNLATAGLTCCVYNNSTTGACDDACPSTCVYFSECPYTYGCSVAATFASASCTDDGCQCDPYGNYPGK